MDKLSTEAMHEDFPKCMRELRTRLAEFDALYKKNLHDTLQQTVAAVEFLEHHPESFREFLRDVYFGAVREACRPSAAIFLYLEQAIDRDLLKRCRRRGRAVEILRRDGNSPERIAEEFSQDSMLQVLEDLTELDAQS